MLSILAFLASGPGGALLGLLIKLWDKKSEDKLKSQEIQANKELGLRGETADFIEKMHKGTAGELKEVKYAEDYFWGLVKRSGTKWKTFSHTAYSPYSRIIGLCLFMLVTTLCISVGIMLLEPWWNYYSLSPEGAKSSGSIGIGPISFYKWTGDPAKPVALNAGGAAFYILAAINFAATTAIIGGTGKSRK